MNTQIETPAYVVNVCYPVKTQRNKSFTFRGPDLLSARHIAFQAAQQIAVEKNPNDVIDITIELVETCRSIVGGKHRSIATIVNQRLNRTSFISEEDIDLLLEVDRNSLFAKSLPDSIFLTIGLNRSHKDGNSLEVIQKVLTADELTYYQQHGYVTNLPQHQE
ncbi:hypothetical protein [Spirosoma jeollabukense]